MSTIFDSFVNQYALSKTLRFELRAVGETLDNMRQHLRYDQDLQTFLADQEIENAYQTLKPVFDALHEEFITDSLQSEAAKVMDFSQYILLYKEKADLKKIEGALRNNFTITFLETANIWKNRIGKNEKGKEILTQKGYKILTEKGILDYIQKNTERFSEIISATDIHKALESFKGSFTYFSGFNQNRENYYETKKEASTAVSTRIVHDNLPKFCDNVLLFELRSKDYLDIYDVLQKLGRTLVNKSGKTLDAISKDLFQITRFNFCLSQKQIEQYNEMIGNANALINLYNQSKKEEKNFKKLSLFKTLYKQIGCGKRDSLFFTLTHDTKKEAEKFRENGKTTFSVEEILELSKKAGEKYFQNKSNDEVINTVHEFLEYVISRKNYLGIYWSKMAINTISNKYFANWHDLKDKLKQAKVFEKAKRGSDDDVKIPETVELEGIFKILDETKNWKKVLFKNSILENEMKKKIVEESISPSQALLKLIFSDITSQAEMFLQESKNITNLKEYTNKESKEMIKLWLDHALSINQMLKYFAVKENKIKGNRMDSFLSEGLKNLLHSSDADWFQWYDALRNYLTKKPQDNAKENKLKLNFENTTLAGGWDVNKEASNYCVILQNSEGKQFLAIIAKQSKQKGFNKIFEKNENNPLYKTDGGEVWEKMEYKLLPGPNKMLPKCLLPKSNRIKYGATPNILELYDRGEFKKGESTFSLKSLHSLIDFYKSALSKYEDWKVFDFTFRKTQEYADISQFYSDVEKQGYKLDFIPVNKSILDQWIKEGRIYLFEIKNQDSNEGKSSSHKNNLHTLYWKALFENILNRPKLNGEAEIFYRKALSGKDIEKTTDRKGKEIIKNFRYSKEKFLFHVPITLNFCLKNERINDLVQEHVAMNKKVYFLGIDRGEKHLAYYYLLDQDGNRIEEGTLNIPFRDKDGNQRTIKAEKRTIGKDGKELVEMVECRNYNELLEARAGDRDYARKNWQTIGTIKELKNGYISQVVRIIADLAIKHNAFIVLEDLNTGFKRGRQKIEKSIYQKFELALAKKLNFLVDKSAKNGEIKSVTKALQLTPPVSNYGDIENRKQVGIMLYTRANYTSQTDPLTGWRKSMYLQKGSEENIKEQIVKSFSEMGFDGKDYYFTYSDKNTKKQWTLYSGKNGKSLDRFRGARGKDKNIWEVTPQKIVEILEGVFMNFDKNRSFYSQIVDEGIELTKVGDHTAWESLRFAIDLIQQIRNTGTEDLDGDFILSPVRDEKGNHFDSRTASDKLPSSGDANGAFNIARKGIIMNEHIKRGYSLFISDTEWDVWLTGKENWEDWMKANEKDLKGVKKK